MIGVERDTFFCFDAYAILRSSIQYRGAFLRCRLPIDVTVWGVNDGRRCRVFTCFNTIETMVHFEIVVFVQSLAKKW